MWTAGFGRGFGPVVRQTDKWMDETTGNFGNVVLEKDGDQLDRSCEK
jgi:hypothetical protein